MLGHDLVETLEEASQVEVRNGDGLGCCSGNRLTAGVVVEDGVVYELTFVVRWRTLSRHKHNDKRLERGAMIINLANGEVLPTAHAVQTQTQR